MKSQEKYHYFGNNIFILAIQFIDLIRNEKISKGESIMNYGAKMKEIRIINNKNQSDIAKILNISPYTYSHYETQDAIMPLKHLINFCEYFNISIDYIFGFTEKTQYKNANKNIKLENNNLRIYRKLNNITQKELAKKLNITQSSISEYEKGHKIISTPILFSICKKYNISADYLLGKTDNPKHIK